MSATPQERLALGAVAVLLAAGAGARMLRPEPPPAEWSGAAFADAELAAGLREATAEEVSRAEARARPLGAGEMVDPNTATADELDRLPKVGPALAERIVAWREERGAFRTLADLDAVPGVGPAMLRAAAPHLSLPPGPPSAGGGDADGPPAVSPPRPGAPVALNAAPAEELDALPGIGPALAERIVAWRAAHGPFRSVDALADVPGIGARTVERIRPLVRASP